MRCIVAIILLLGVWHCAAAQGIPGFPREDFGKVVLSSKQVAGAKLEAAIAHYNNEPISNYGARSVLYRSCRTCRTARHSYQCQNLPVHWIPNF